MYKSLILHSKPLDRFENEFISMGAFVILKHLKERLFVFF